MRFILPSFCVLFVGCLPAQAHWGHVGELAGHGHLLGIGALVGAAALAAALRKPKREKSEPAPEPGEEPDAEGEAA